MQSPTQETSESNLVTAATTEHPLDTGTEAQPAPSDTDIQENNNAAGSIETELIVTSQENETEVQKAETPAAVAVAQAVESDTAVPSQNEPSENTGPVETDSASKASAPTEPENNSNAGHDVQKAKKQNKSGHDGRKYVLSKKAMIDPLKMDMSKPVVMPLTCESFILFICRNQCLIIKGNLLFGASVYTLIARHILH